MTRLAALCLLSGALLAAQAQAGNPCASFVEAQKKYLLAATDSVGHDSEQSAQIEKMFAPLRSCQRRYCVAASADTPSAGDLALVSADRLRDIADPRPAVWAWAGIGQFDHRKLGKVCVLALYSGGSGAEWLVQGATSDGGYRIAGAEPSIHGDTFEASTLLAAMKDTQARIRWGKARPAPGSAP
jgi:hypothetical protein